MTDTKFDTEQLPYGEVIQEGLEVYLINEGWWLWLLCHLKILTRRYEWLTFRKRFILHVMDSPIDVFTEYLELDRRMERGILSTTEGRLLLKRMHLQNTPIGHCHYTLLGRYEFKHLFGKIIF